MNRHAWLLMILMVIGIIAFQKNAEARRLLCGECSEYVTRRGDTLSAISLKFLGEASHWKEKIADRNGITDETRLPIGKTLRICASIPDVPRAETEALDNQMSRKIAEEYEKSIAKLKNDWEKEKLGLFGKIEEKNLRVDFLEKAETEYKKTIESQKEGLKYLIDENMNLQAKLREVNEKSRDTDATEGKEGQQSRFGTGGENLLVENELGQRRWMFLAGFFPALIVLILSIFVCRHFQGRASKVAGMIAKGPPLVISLEGYGDYIYYPEFKGVVGTGKNTGFVTIHSLVAGDEKLEGDLASVRKSMKRSIRDFISYQSKNNLTEEQRREFEKLDRAIRALMKDNRLIQSYK